MMADNGRLRIGELSRRVGESPELLRAWESRYGIVGPERTPGGLRLYSEEDERRVRLMRHHIAGGLSASEAARLAKLPVAQPELGGELREIELALERSIDTLDEAGVQTALDRVFVAFELEAALAQVVLPLLRRIGERWAAAQVSVALEHFASNAIGGRLRALARGWGQGVGPRAVLACPPGEQHELGLLCFGLALRQAGWRITYLGADTPLADICDMLDELVPAIVVAAAVIEQPFLDAVDDVRALSKRARVGIGGAGSSQKLADLLGAELLGTDVFQAAQALAP